jgi:hypothetical protein
VYNSINVQERSLTLLYRLNPNERWDVGYAVPRADKGPGDLSLGPSALIKRQRDQRTLHEMLQCEHQHRLRLYQDTSAPYCEMVSIRSHR